MFNKAFIILKPLASNCGEKKVDLSFAKYSYNLFIKTNKAWKFKLCDFNTIYVLKAIPLLNLLFCKKNFVLYINYIFFLTKMLGLKIEHINNTIIKEQVIVI